MSKFEKKFYLNLTNNKDPNFKTLKILQTENNLFVDIRQTNKGRASPNGICILIPEFRWLIKKLFENENKQFDKFLEYGSRTTHVVSDGKSVYISLTKLTGDFYEIELTSEEMSKIMGNLNTIEQKIGSLSRECKVSIEFDEELYFNEIDK